MMTKGQFLLIIILFSLKLSSSISNQPHVVYFMADDLGWNDVGIHNRHIHTPALDKMAAEGLELTQSYVLPVCSPSRHALFTGRYPFRDGAQHLVYDDVRPKCTSFGLTWLPQRLQQLGYSTHLVGKWHQGYCHVDCTPTKRGFDSFYGFYGGYIDHNNHTRTGFADFRDNQTAVNDKQGIYSTYLFNQKAEEIIDNHDTDKPIFLVISFDMPHAPLQAPDHMIQKYSHIKDEGRRIYLAMVATFDESIANITKLLNDKGMMKDTLLIFQSDNGGQPLFGGNNYPLRGGKLTLWEGGTKSVTLLSGGYLKGRKGQLTSLFHITDWYPTLIHAAGGSVEPSTDGHIDGIDQLDVILKGDASRREEFVYNLDIHTDKFFPYSGYGAYRYKNYKLLLGFTGAGDISWSWPWLRPSEMCESESSKENPECQNGEVLLIESEEAKTKRVNPDLKILKKLTKVPAQLYDIEADPYEKNDLSGSHPEMVAFLTERIHIYMDQVALPVMPKPIVDGKLATKDGFYSPGWCTKEELLIYQQYSQGYIKSRRETTCNMYDGDDETCNIP